jgi:hypothetical protein
VNSNSSHHIVRRLPLAAAILALAVAAGCSTHHDPPQVMVTPLTEYTSAAKGQGCAMPVLVGNPARTYKQIAIVEGWGDVDQGPEVIEAARRRACETGADALVVVTGKAQRVTKQLYGVTPNDTADAAISGGSDVKHGQYIHQQEYRPAPGEAGHTGYYLDTVAIVYLDQPSAAPGSVAGPH